MNYKHFVSVIASQLSCSPLQRLLKVEPATDSFLCSLSLSLPHQNLICNFPTKPTSHCTALIFTSPEIPALTMRGLIYLTNILFHHVHILEFPSIFPLKMCVVWCGVVGEGARWKLSISFDFCSDLVMAKWHGSGMLDNNERNSHYFLARFMIKLYGGSRVSVQR